MDLGQVMGTSAYGSITVQGHESTGHGGQIYFGAALVYVEGAGWASGSIRTISLPSPASEGTLTLLRRFATPKS